MKTVDTRDLQHNLSKYLDEVERGETIVVRRRRRVIATIAPTEEVSAPEAWPDIQGRLAKLYKDRSIVPTASSILYTDRGD